MASALIRIGCAGWALGKKGAEALPPPGSHLHRYARRMNAVEINSSFYRPHRRATYERWAASVPAGFRFSVKVPRDITHTARLADSEELLARFLEEISGLGDKLGPLLVQLPPQLGYDRKTAAAFFTSLRRRYAGDVVCEPRNAEWFGRMPTALLRKFHVGRVAADPAPVLAAALPSGFGGVAYYRLHGSPRKYYSSYASETLLALAERVRADAARGREVWCIFDNTAAGAALENAVALQRLIEGGR